MSNDNKTSNSLGLAMLNWAGPDFWCVYADGYKRAAELLIESEKNVYETNTVIFPILALYRQYLELSLKEIIAYGQYVCGENDFPHHHVLNHLWAAAKDYVVKVYPAFGQEQLDRLQRYVQEIDYYDPTAQGARYPAIKPKGKAKTGMTGSFSHAPIYLSLDQLREHIDEAGQLLSEITSAMAILKDCEAEARSIAGSI